jgi:oligopeptide/dipeptide ABC transporter ATP-binding protein
MTNNGTLLNVQDLKMYFPITQGIIIQRHIGDIKAVDGISFSIQPGETMGLVGESGCGKSTTGRAILQLYRPTAGRVLFKDQDLTQLKGEALRRMRRQMQMIFQDPYASLNPRKPIGHSIMAGLEIHNIGTKQERTEIVHEMLKKVGLADIYANRYPYEFSGGQRQRIGIARALALRPKFILCDEPVSALDVSIQSQVLNLLRDLQAEFGLTYLFIAHNLSVVEHISDRVAVMYLGKIVELAPKAELFRDPLHPYTQALISAIPIPKPDQDRKRIVLQGEVPSPLNPPSGCRFHPRCPAATDECKHAEPEFKEYSTHHWVACFNVKK